MLFLMKTVMTVVILTPIKKLFTERVKFLLHVRVGLEASSSDNMIQNDCDNSVIRLLWCRVVKMERNISVTVNWFFLCTYLISRKYCLIQHQYFTNVINEIMKRGSEDKALRNNNTEIKQRRRP